MLAVDMSAINVCFWKPCLLHNVYCALIIVIALFHLSLHQGTSSTQGAKWI
ncbi:hypothetical protein L228DRAFT_260255 [Xylona heveae TC161]|uniref:Uncharacterized protein n=1 Tax=Xylona heveae (strain CBS 132557 / TC161) TaxID=1328760 RepID=A0A165HFD7_XYLHT|nr:hypothetical protein L228DRAFT_260255 [Xylona heveae TC161]KZF23428.1 hypothetical protein L228DRAFT_260255 [Xylona heveae TC161]